MTWKQAALAALLAVGLTACQCYEVAGRGAPVPVLLARQRGGSCGLDAWHHTYQRRAGA